ncbi:MAG: T9SS type A sorting domain-containing protein [bacterium]|nr:T9SS type A sorting domain-containing protein [bacterium]
MLEHNLTNEILTGVLFTSPNNGYIIGGEKTILKYTLLSDVEVQSNIPAEFKLEQNYPNPFNPSTVISYQLPVSSNVTLKVYDVLGDEIATLVDEYKTAGKYEIEFNSRSGNVRNLPSSVYFYQLKAGDFVETKKMILLK